MGGGGCRCLQITYVRPFRRHGRFACSGQIDLEGAGAHARAHTNAQAHARDPFPPALARSPRARSGRCGRALARTTAATRTTGSGAPSHRRRSPPAGALAARWGWRMQAHVSANTCTRTHTHHTRTRTYAHFKQWTRLRARSHGRPRMRNHTRARTHTIHTHLAASTHACAVARAITRRDHACACRRVHAHACAATEALSAALAEPVIPSAMQGSRRSDRSDQGRGQHGRSDRTRQGRSDQGRGRHWERQGRSDQGRGHGSQGRQGRSDQGRGHGSQGRQGRSDHGRYGHREELPENANWGRSDGPRPWVDCQGVVVQQRMCGGAGVAAPTRLPTPRKCGLPGALFISNIDAVASTAWLSAVSPSMVVTAAGDEGEVGFPPAPQTFWVSKAISGMRPDARITHLPFTLTRLPP